MENRKGPSKILIEEEAGQTNTVIRQIELTIDGDDFRIDWQNLDHIVDNKSIDWEKDAKKTTIFSKNRVLEYNEYENNVQKGSIRPSSGFHGNQLFYPYSYNSMVQFAGFKNYQYNPEQYKYHNVVETDDGPMDVVVLQSTKYKSYVKEIGVYRNNGRLGLYKVYKDGCLTECHAFSKYIMTQSGSYYPTSISYTKYESKLPAAIREKVEKGDLELFDKEVLGNSDVDFEHSWNWELEEVKIRQNISKNVFDFSFPPGTEVVDSTGAVDIEYTIPASDMPALIPEKPNLEIYKSNINDVEKKSSSKISINETPLKEDKNENPISSNGDDKFSKAEKITWITFGALLLMIVVFAITFKLYINRKLKCNKN